MNKKEKQTPIFTYNTLDQASALIRQGGLVAFPTETVYGLGARADDAEAVAQVFEAKGRPQDNPLIVHVGQRQDVEKLVSFIPSLAQDLMDAFWPGPLTLVLPALPGVLPENVTGGLPTVAVRMPKQLEALLLIDMVGFPIVGPSANLSGKPSPTKVEHVLHDFNGKIDGIVSAHHPLTEHGLESTVLAFNQDQIEILRPGVITKGDLSKVVSVPIIERSSQEQLASGQVLSPGVKYRHYSPEQVVYLVDATHPVEDWPNLLDELPEKAFGLLADQEVLEALASHQKIQASYSLGEAGDWQEANRQLFAGLRALEAEAVEAIIVQGMPSTEEYHAYANRLTKAADHVI